MKPLTRFILFWIYSCSLSEDIHSHFLLVNFIFHLFVRVFKCKRVTEWSAVEAGVFRIHPFGVKGSLGGHFVTSHRVTWSLAVHQLLCIGHFAIFLLWDPKPLDAVLNVTPKATQNHTFTLLKNLTEQLYLNQLQSLLTILSKNEEKISVKYGTWARTQLSCRRCQHLWSWVINTLHLICLSCY